MSGRYLPVIKRVLRIVFAPVIWFFTTSEREERWLEAFANWFGGVPAFKQQTFVILLWLVSILTGWIHDPSMLHFMMALTIYSAITQPVLAIGNTIANRSQARQDEKQRHMQEAMRDMLDVLIAVSKRVDERTEDIADELSER